MMSVSFQLYQAISYVDVEYETLIQRVSHWGALASTIMAVFGIACLAYNKNKFLQENPDWKNFDQAF